ncbi:hypothetical protein BC829DRAFT_441650 [Chytridium lagenaria]|nr:hypothetical protein BC829DRAFT_441650 [Chytridium lagenaria]
MLHHEASGGQGILNTASIIDVLLLRPSASPNKLIDVSSDTRLADVLALMKKHRVTSIAVYGQKQHFVGAGELNICTKDRQYIGTVTILDVILHLSKRTRDPASLASSRIFEVIGSSSEGRTLWIGRPDLPLRRTLEPLAKGVHRLLVPIWSNKDSTTTLSHASNLSVSSLSLSSKHAEDPDHYALATQSDVLRFLHHHLQIMDASTDSFLQTLPPILPTLTGMASMAIQAVPVIRDDNVDHDPTPSLPGIPIPLSSAPSPRLTFARSSRTIYLDGLSVEEFVRRVKGGFMLDPAVLGPGLTCSLDDGLERIVSTMVAGRVHRLWVVEAGRMVGVFSMTDVIKAVLEISRRC